MSDEKQLMLESLAIEEELMKLKLARLKLKHFAPYVFPWYKTYRHHAMLMEKLEAVERYVKSGGKDGIGRLIINMPPQHGKSVMSSITFPAWFLGRNPDYRVVIASYGASLAEDFSRKVRNLLESSEYQKVFGKLSSRDSVPEPVQLDPDGRSVQSWEILGHRGGLVAAGVGGGLSGRSAELLIIDDPIKGDEEADSEVIRQKVIDWYTSVAFPRLQKSGAIVIILTRWHEEDLAGWLLEKEGQKWEKIVLPAIAEENDPLKRIPGEALWPEERSVEFLMDRKSLLPPRHWNALYQQSPSGEEGDVFNQNWFTYGIFPDIGDISYGIQVWDCAMTEKEQGDYSACVTLYVTRSGVFVADVYRDRLPFPDLKQRMFDLYTQWNRVFRISRICIENRVAGTSVIQSLKKGSHLPIIPLEPDSRLGRSKLQRAQSASGYVQAGRVTFQKNAHWITDFENELLKFPHGKHDDMVDAFVYGINQVQGGGRAPKKSLTRSSGWGDFGLRPNRHETIMGGF